MDPVGFTTHETTQDPDQDGLANRDEYLLGFHPLQFTPHALTLDRDNDGMPDHYEAQTATYQFSITLWEHSYTRKLDWDVADGHLDFDHDTLTNITEYTITTDPVYWDTDLDMLPDAWEHTNALNPKSNLGHHGTEGDFDGEGLSNIDELIHGTRADLADTDGDGATDKQEVDQGSDPTKNTDNGQASDAWQYIDVPFRVGDPSASKSEIWKMIIQGTGPEDTRKFEFVSPTYGQMGDKTFKLRKWNRYTISLQHIGTKKEEPEPDYDWEAQVAGKPISLSEAETPTTGTNNFFTVKDHWLVDNRRAVFTTEKHGNEENIVSGKYAHLIPVVIHDVGNKSKMSPTGTDDVSVTANPTSGGYKPDFWIMAPQGGTPSDKNEMYFQIPLTPDAKLSYTSNNATPTPAEIMLHASPWLTESPVVTWRGNGIQTTDERPTFQIGIHNTSVQLPIQVMSMKKRTVKVAIFPVKLPTAPRNVPIPDKTALEAWLNSTFGNQINAWFEVTYMQQTVHNYLSSDGSFAYRVPQFNSMFVMPEYANTSNHIRIFLVDLVKIGDIQSTIDPTIPPFGLGALGVASRNNNGGAVLAGGYTPNGEIRKAQEVIETITHEIGHIIVGEGHPDENDGPAILEGTDRTNRLMCSGDNRKPGARLLVKAEWDKAEAWMKEYIEGNQ